MVGMPRVRVRDLMFRQAQQPPPEPLYPFGAHVLKERGAPLPALMRGWILGAFDHFSRGNFLENQMGFPVLSL